MSLFLPNIPQPGDNLDFSQGQLLSNNQGLDTVFGIDHYKFSDATANKGFHNQVTTVAFAGGGDPITPAATCRLYARQLTAPVGLLQFSRGPSNAVPTPVTSLHSPAAPLTILPSTTTNIVDFAGLTTVYAKLFAYNANSASIQTMEYDVFFTSTAANTFTFVQVIANSTSLNLAPTNSGTILQLRNNSGSTTYSNIFWTLEFVRIQ